MLVMLLAVVLVLKLLAILLTLFVRLSAPPLPDPLPNPGGAIPGLAGPPNMTGLVKYKDEDDGTLDWRPRATELPLLLLLVDPPKLPTRTCLLVLELLVRLRLGDSAESADDNEEDDDDDKDPGVIGTPPLELLLIGYM